MMSLSPSRWFNRAVPAPRRAPASRLATPTVANLRGLRFTEMLLLGVLSLAYLLAISQPVFGMQLHLTIFNHFPLVLLGPVLLLHLCGAMLNHRPPPWQAIWAICWPLLLLALYALVGSSVAKWEYKQFDTYISFAVYLLLLPLYAAMVPTQTERLHAWARALITVWVVFSLVALVGEAARFGVKETLHEIEYVVTSGFLVLYYAVRNRLVKLLAITLLVLAAVLNQKLTGFIIVALALVHILVGAGWRRLLPQWRGLYGVAAVAFVLALVAALTLVYFEYRQYLPSGNVQVRLKQYEAVWRGFMSSPIWGNAYLEGSGEAYREYLRVLNIPTHSDVLDILKHGGLIGLGLFGWGYWKIFALINRAVSATKEQALLNAYFVAVRFFQVTALVTFAINPILLKGSFLIVIWGNLGLAIGLALTATRGWVPPAPALPKSHARPMRFV